MTSMTRKSYTLWTERIGVLLLCAVLPTWLGAQTETGAGTKQANMPADTTSAKAHDNSYVIGNDDVLAINVWKEPDISRSIPVRSDGKISLPLVGELQAAGQTPDQLEQQIAAKLKSFIAEPEVTVMCSRSTAKSSISWGRSASQGRTRLLIR